MGSEQHDTADSDRRSTSKSGDIVTTPPMETASTPSVEGAPGDLPLAEGVTPPVTSDETGEPAARPAGDETTKSSGYRKIPPIRTLVDLFTVKGANAARLLKEVSKSPSWKFDDKDVDLALQLLPEQDPKLKRTRQLLWESIETHDGRFARAAGDFAIRVIGPDLDGRDGWPLDDHGDPEVALGTLARTLAEPLANPKSRIRAQNTLMIGVDLLSHRQGMSFETAAPVLRETIGVPEPEVKSNPRRRRVASVTLPRNDLETIRDLLGLLDPWQRELGTAEAAAATARTEARDARERAEAAEVAARDWQAKLGDAQAEIERLRQETMAARDQVHDVRVHADVDVVQLRARTVAFLNSRLRDLLATAKEASETEPPRTATALRLLDRAIQELRKEVEWLKSSG